jgi:hypothetical protein
MSYPPQEQRNLGSEPEARFAVINQRLATLEQAQVDLLTAYYRLESCFTRLEALGWQKDEVAKLDEKS